MTNDEIANLLATSIDSNDNDNVQQIPRHFDGRDYAIENLALDQRETLVHVLQVLRQYCDGQIENEDEVFRLTVAGGAGSGKSTWINTLVACVRKMFPDDDTVSVFAPTGNAAFNAGGQTIHAGCMLPVSSNTIEMSGMKQKVLLKRFSKTLIIIIDERSMLDATVLGTMKHYMQQCAHGGKKLDHPWGGIPIIILVGDDYQLPPIKPGAFYARTKWKTKITSQASIREQGLLEFLEIGQKVIFLDGEKRVNQGQDTFKRILRSIRCEDDTLTLLETDKERLLQLHLSHISFTDAQRKQIQDEALYVFANKEPRDHLNNRKLKQANTETNPVARIKSKTVKPSGRQVLGDKHFDLDRYPNKVLICKGARVTLNGCNLAPKQGLYHGSLGIVRDIVYHTGQSPSTDDFPAYVLVEFSHYSGRELINGMPKCVPVVPHTVRCSFNCCSRTYIPLALAYGKTAHTFQGQTVGPTPPGRPQNPIKKIIVDPGKRQFEGTNVGLFYQLLSRATTIGDQHDKLSSAIYFDGDNFTAHRFQKLTMKNDTEMYKMAALRKKWVGYLKRNKLPRGQWKQKDMEEVIHWANTTVIHHDELEKLIKKKTARK